MDPEQWAKIDALFHQLRSLSEAERSQLLERAGITLEIRREVESLLAQDRGGTNSLRQALVEVVNDALAEHTGQPQSLVGRSIGSYPIKILAPTCGYGTSRARICVD